MIYVLQQPNQHQANGNDGSLHHLLPPLAQQQQHAPHVGGGGGGSISSSPSLTADQARAQAQAQLAKMAPPPEALKCPRCESTNTKFCYFNNYSLSQPRHFCKTCKRYWTRGGALRNVPVGGGFRRNKKHKKSNSSSSSTSESDKQSLSNSTTNELNIPTNMTSTLQNLSFHGGNMIQAQHNGYMGFQIGGGHGGSSTLEGPGVDQWWRFQQFPNILNGFHESSTTSAVSSFPLFQGESVEAHPSGFVGDVGGVASRVLNLSRSPLTISENINHQNSWTGLSSLAPSSSASHHFL